jgi:hypothetical protein
MGAGGDIPMVDPPVTSCKQGASFAPARISLMNDAQLVNAVRDVFGVELPAVVTGTRQDQGSYNFSDELAQMSTPMLDAYLAAADKVAIGVKPCGAAPLEAACMEQYLRRTLPRAWRRPVEDQEIAGLLQIFNAGLAINGDVALEATMEAVLTSGSFLYRSEIGKSPPASGDTAVALTPHELAAAVSFAVTNSVPDDVLVAKANDGSLMQPSVLASEIDRLMATPPAKANLQSKASYLLSLERVRFVQKDTFSFPQFTTSVRDGLYRGSQKFLGDVMWSGHFTDLFTSHRVYANQEMASVYGMPAVTGSDLAALDIAGDERGAGILTQPAFLAATNFHAATDDIVHRGLYVYYALVCGEQLGDPPPNEDAVFSTLKGSEREKALQRDELTCGACHRLFDPLGLVSEKYDPIGRYRATWPEDPSWFDPNSAGKPIDSSATISGLGDDLDGPVNGINDFAGKLAAGRRASDCVAGQMMEMMVDHRGATDSCDMQKVRDAFVKSQSFHDLFLAIVTSPAFLKRDWDPK